MGKGMIIFGLLGVGTVIAGKSQDAYNFVSKLYQDTRFIPTVLIVVTLLVISSLTTSPGGKKLVRAVAVLIAISLIFARHQSTSKGVQNG